MTRVSDKSNIASLEFAMNRAKRKLEDLQLKGGSLKKIIAPSDDPAGNISLMKFKTQINNIDNYQKNVNRAQTILEYTEDSLKELIELAIRTKELAIGQASNLHNPEIRKSVSAEIKQMKNQVMNIANRRLENRYIFAGQKTDTRPFDSTGKYKGDSGIIYLEVAKDYYVQTNTPGDEVFFYYPQLINKDTNPVDDVMKGDPKTQSKGKGEYVDSIFAQMQTFINASETNSPEIIQGLLVRLDNTIDRIITLRTKIGAATQTILSASENLGNAKMFLTKQKSSVEDADVAKLFSDLAQQKYVLNAVYKTSAQLLNSGLINFIK